MKIHTRFSERLLKEIERKTNIKWGNTKSPTVFKHINFQNLFLNRYGDNTLSGNFMDSIEDSTRVSYSEFISECIRIAPKKGE